MTTAPTSTISLDIPPAAQPPEISPIFILGAHRSGTTLLRYMLSSHPRLHIPEESNFIAGLFARSPNKPLSAPTAERHLRTIFEKYPLFVQQWQGRNPEFSELFDPAEVITPTTFIDRIFSTFASQNRKSRWGDKTPYYTSHLPLLHHLFPQAKFIHLLRDGRDVALSVQRVWGQSEWHVDIYFAAKTWRQRIIDAREAARQIDPSQYVEIHYEELTANPERQLRQICEFIGEDFDKRMLRPENQVRKSHPEGVWEHHDLLQSPPTPRHAVWREEMTRDDLAAFQSVAGDMLTACGYEIESTPPPSLRQRARMTALALKYGLYRTARAGLEITGHKPPSRTRSVRS